MNEAGRYKFFGIIQLVLLKQKISALCQDVWKVMVHEGTTEHVKSAYLSSSLSTPMAVCVGCKSRCDFEL